MELGPSCYSVGHSCASRSCHARALIAITTYTCRASAVVRCRRGGCSRGAQALRAFCLRVRIARGRAHARPFGRRCAAAPTAICFSIAEFCRLIVTIMASAGDCARGLEKRRPLEKRRSHLFRFPRVKVALVVPAKLGKGHGRGLQNLEAHKLHGVEEIYGQRSVKACVHA